MLPALLCTDCLLNVCVRDKIRTFIDENNPGHQSSILRVSDVSGGFQVWSMICFQIMVEQMDFIYATRIVVLRDIIISFPLKSGLLIWTFSLTLIAV